MISATDLYTKAWDIRLPKNSPEQRTAQRSFLRLASTHFFYLQLLILGLFCYMLGSLFQQTSRVYELSVLFVDYDGGAIGNAVRVAYESLQGKGFPSIIERSTSQFPGTHDLFDAVCRSNFQAAFYVAQGASGRLQAALTGSETYNNTDIMAYIWNEAFYPYTLDSAISANMKTLSEAARVIYTTAGGMDIISTVTTSAALSTLANPWNLQSINIQPTIQGSRMIYNTVVIILILMQQFFYLNTIITHFTGNISSLQICSFYWLLSPVRYMLGALLHPRRCVASREVTLPA